MDKSKIKYNKIFGSAWMKDKDFCNYVMSDKFISTLSNINSLYSKERIFPTKKNVFRIFRNTDPKNIRVVILGQDPYSTGHANGYAFANNDNVKKLSPSLQKIFDNINKYYGKKIYDPDVTLQHWVDQGVFLYNTALTVQFGKAGGHVRIWEDFTSFVINNIIDNNPGVIFCLWGTKAQQIFNQNVSSSKLKFCYVLKETHPAYSAYNNIDWQCDHFNKINKIIENQNGKEYCIKW